MKLLVVLGLSLSALMAPAAFADGPLSATLDARKVLVDAHGAESFGPADTARPNDVLEYRASYRNRAPKSLRGVTATLPIPVGFEYLPNTAGKHALASLDGETYAAIPLTRVVRQPDGSEQVQAVPVAEYRFLRWPLGDI